jgi:hypothetical protein
VLADRFADVPKWTLETHCNDFELSARTNPRRLELTP